MPALEALGRRAVPHVAGEAGASPKPGSAKADRESPAADVSGDGTGVPTPARPLR